jgi:multidrug transporter EmrE-like cation transporter
MSKTAVAYLCLGLGIVIGCWGEFYICRWAKASHARLDLLVGLGLYCVDVYCWTVSLRYGLLFWRAGLIWTLASLVFCVFCGMWFSEKPSLINWVGILMACAAIILIEL